MKYLTPFWIAALLAALQMSCQNQTDLKQVLQENADSLTVEMLDSPEGTDIWKKYSYLERQGKGLFDQYCVICHGQTGEGDGFNAYNLNPRPHSLADSAYMKALSDESLAEIIAFGGRGVNKSVLMPAYQQTLSRYQMSMIIAYIRTLANKL